MLPARSRPRRLPLPLGSLALALALGTATATSAARAASDPGLAHVHVVSAADGRVSRVAVSASTTDYMFLAQVGKANAGRLRRFALTPEPRDAAGGGGSVPGPQTWQAVLRAARGRRSHPRLLLAAVDETSPASCVDPFWAVERTNLPQPRGIAANWYSPSPTLACWRAGVHAAAARRVVRCEPSAE